jgi:predicted signal transduction protein with EAL and GGDEF domain
MGIAISPDHGRDVSSLFRRADLALQAAKSEGRAQFRFFDRGMEHKIDRQATVSRALRGAIRAGDFNLLFQPKVDLATKRVSGLEALIRWTDAELGFVSPEEFIAIAEKTGSIHGLGRWVFTETCRTLARWRAEGLGTVRVAVNVSAEELRDPSFGTGVFARLQEYQIDPSQIEIEITERSLLDEDIVMMTHLRDLRATGIRISLDDFGAGYSTLACISRVDLDSIKMDRSLVVDVELQGRATKVAAAVVTLARMSDMEVVAEGVETKEQEATLRELRCHQAQGYLYSRPVPAEMVHELLRNELPLKKPTDH